MNMFVWVTANSYKTTAHRIHFDFTDFDNLSPQAECTVHLQLKKYCSSRVSCDSSWLGAAF